METPILSISIPTYNRAHCLGDCLESIVSQLTDPELLERVEIVISDNASTDTTRALVDGFMARYKNIHYFCNSENLGFDKNILAVVEKSRGTYCLTLGDDDALLPGALALILDKITTIRARYYILSNWGHDNALINPVVPHPNRPVKQDIIFEKLSDFVRTIKEPMSLVGTFGGMSTQLFERSGWIGLKEREDHIGSQAVHIFILLRAFQNHRFALIAEPCIKTRNENVRWDTFPGLETRKKQTISTISTALWIAGVYNLNMPSSKIRMKLMTRYYVLLFKDFVKKILSLLGLRK